MSANKKRTLSVHCVGFTLIELLVVIGIIALLMAILLPALRRVRKQARALTCRANLKQWGTLLALYTDENEGHFPNGGISGAIFLLRTPFYSEEDPNRLVTLHNPVDTKGIARCPMAAKVDRNSVKSTYIFTTHVDSFTWPLAEVLNGSTTEPWEVARPAPPFLCSYGFNQWLLTAHLGLSTRLSSPWYVDVLSLKGHNGVPVLLGCTLPSAQPSEREGPPPRPSDTGGREMVRFCLDRHEGYTNGLFLDWSVRTVGLKELWTLKWHRDYNTEGPWTKAGGITPLDWPEWMRTFKDW